MLYVLHISVNVKKWEKSVSNDEKELDKVKNDESRHMKVWTIFYSYFVSVKYKIETYCLFLLWYLVYFVILKKKKC